jgi:hypothetical protein
MSLEGSSWSRAASIFTLASAAALALLPSTAEAGGDAVYGTRGGNLLSEREHQVEISFARGHAELKVRRTVHNGIERHEEAQLWLDLPFNAVATGLRTLGEHQGKPRWFAADLLEAEAAAARYEELTGLGGYYPKDPALLSWRDQGSLALQVFPIAPNSDKTIEYTLELPASYEDGRWRVWLPSLGSEAVTAEAVLEPAEPLDQLFVDGEVVARGHHLSLDRELELALAPRDPAPYSLSLASVDTGERHLAHWQLSLAPQISTIPREAQIVVLIDLSRSIDESALEAQRRAALAYLEHFRDPGLAAEVAVLGFERELHSIAPGFVSAAEAITALEQAELKRRNGSEVELALAKADELLASRRKRGPRRIVLLSDFETASRVSPERAQASVEHSRAIAHLVTLEHGAGASLWREDGHPWAKVAAASQGVLWNARSLEEWSDADAREQAMAVFEELARPVRIDQLAIRVEGLSPEDPDTFAYLDDTLAEGQGLEQLLLSATPGRKLIVEGLTWNIPLSRSAKPSREQGDRWSALVFGSNVLWELSEAEMMTLAMRGGAVSPVTSYLAIEPGVRPSTEGIEEWERGGFGIGSAAGFGALGRRAPRVVVASPFDKQAWLEAQLRGGWVSCGGIGAEGKLALETQSAEILEVTLTQAGDDAGLAACMEQIAWSLELPGRFSSFETWAIDL